LIQVVILAPALAIRAGLRTLLTADEQVEVLAEAATLAELEMLPPGTDIILTVAEALARPELDTLIEELGVPPAVLVLSDEAGAANQLAGLPLRAWGLLPEDSSEEELLASLHSLYQGLVTAAPALIQPLLGAVAAAERDDLIVDDLTTRELEVLELLAEGLANKQIAYELEISEHTVKFHVSSIYTKLGVTNRTEAVMVGARLGLIVL
jgi:DNA-binding NarL/FixJ family response regulator